MNKQPALSIVSASPRLLVHSMFRSIQGEGPFSGQPAVFIRMAGCNICCPACDTAYTLPTGSKGRSVVAIIRDVKKFSRSGLVVITGGEPLRQPIETLVTKLLQAGYRVQIETNGTLYRDLPHSPGVTIVCSPKTSYVHRKLEKRINAYKYVVAAGNTSEDGLPQQVMGYPENGPWVARPPRNFRGPVYIMPLDERNRAANQRNTAHAVSLCLEHGFNLCLQIHKIAGVE